ncbi:MAG: hypothetical protein KAR42_01155 [candidate division Zixibacteria bacterium]|nr:hypothetical protein [candidate division Zixibacteria bacterium]
MTSPSSDTQTTIRPVIAGALACLWLLHWLPFLFPQARFWGFNHLLFLPMWGRVVFTIGGFFCLLLFFNPIRQFAGRAFASLSEFLFAHHPRVRWSIVGLASIAIFWLLKPELFWLGDSYSVAANIGNDLPVIYKWSEIGAIYIANFIGGLLPGQSEEVARLAYAIIAVISGGASVYLFFGIASELSEDNQSRLMSWCVMIFGGWIVLFFGYTENYPVLWPLILGYIYSAIQYLKGKNLLIVPAMFLIMALIIHLQALFFTLSFMALMFSRGRGAKFYYQFKKIIWLGLFIIFCAGVFSFIRLYMNSLEFKLYLIPFFTPHAPSIDYTLFSLAHLFDGLNLLWLMSPILPLLIILGWKYRKELLKSKTDLFFGLMTMGGIVFLFIIDPKLGMGRDWDLFALTALMPTLWLIRKTLNQLQSNYFPAIAVLCIVLTFPFVSVQLQEKPAIDNYQYMLAQDIERSRTGLVILKNYYSENSNFAAADSLERVLVNSFPPHILVPLAYNYMDNGRLQAAKEIIDSIVYLNPYSTESLSLLGMYYFKIGQYQKALPYLEASAMMGRYDSRLLVTLGTVYSNDNQHRKAIEEFQQARTLNPDYIPVYEGLCTSYFGLHDYDSSYYYAMQGIQRDSSLANAYMIAGFSAYRMKRSDAAKYYFKTFLALAPESSFKSHVEKTLLTIR